MAIGVVEDFGITELIISGVKLNSFPKRITLNIETNAPTTEPTIIGIKCFFY